MKKFIKWAAGTLSVLLIVSMLAFFGTRDKAHAVSVAYADACLQQAHVIKFFWGFDAAWMFYKTCMGRK